MPDLASIIRDSAIRYGVPPETLLRIAQLESGMDPSAANPNSSARGVFQFLTKPGSTWEKYGRGLDPLDPVANADAGARLARDNINLLKNTLGRDPAPWEVYLTHQQGSAGGPALLQNPNRPAVDVLRAFYKDPSAPITQNAGNTGMTAGQFADLWRAKFENTPIRAAAGVGMGGVRAPDVGSLAAPAPSSVPNPQALVYGPSSLLGSIFDSTASSLKTPEQPAVRTPKRVSSIAEGLGAPVRLSS